MTRSRTFTPEQLHRIRKRHRGYSYLLTVICLVLLSQPLAVEWPLLNSLCSISVALVMMLFLTRNSPFQLHKKRLYVLGITAILFELVWLTTLAESPGLAKHLTILHLLIWSLFIGSFLLRKVRALMIEPYVTIGVLMGAANGYLLIGYLGAFLLHCLLIWQPLSFDPHYLPAGMNPLNDPLEVFPSMVAASFDALTTVSNSVIRPGHLPGHVGTLAITIMGQLYVAVLIGIVLGRFHQRRQP